MTDNTKNIHRTALGSKLKNGAASNSEQQVRAYEKPTLIVYGDVRDITLGPTPGLGESGCEFDREVGSSIQCP